MFFVKKNKFFYIFFCFLFQDKINNKLSNALNALFSLSKNCQEKLNFFFNFLLRIALTNKKKCINSSTVIHNKELKKELSKCGVGGLPYFSQCGFSHY
jgi:hypothetical protein